MTPATEESVRASKGYLLFYVAKRMSGLLGAQAESVVKRTRVS